jgi:uncharacterized protein
VVLALVWVFQRKLVYLPSAALLYPRDEVLPEARDVVLATEDGLRLGAWFLEGAQGGGRKTLVLVCNGNTGDRSLRAALARGIAATGASVLLFDYRGYGGNPGSPSEEGVRSDARAARSFLDTLPGHEQARIVYFGESLGSAVALGLAAERPPDAIVLRSPFPSLVELGRLHYPFLPVRLLLQDRFECIAAAKGLRCPAVVIVGEADRVIPAAISKRLFEAIASEKKLVPVPGADHNDPDLCDGPAVISSFRELLRAAG